MVGRKSSLLVHLKQIKHYKKKIKNDQVPPRVPLKLGTCDAVLYGVLDKLGKKRFGSLLS